jgi:hypothetical protein
MAPQASVDLEAVRELLHAARQPGGSPLRLETFKVAYARDVPALLAENQALRGVVDTVRLVLANDVLTAGARYSLERPLAALDGLAKSKE